MGALLRGAPPAWPSGGAARNGPGGPESGGPPSPAATYPGVWGFETVGHDTAGRGGEVLGTRARRRALEGFLRRSLWTRASDPMRRSAQAAWMALKSPPGPWAACGGDGAGGGEGPLSYWRDSAGEARCGPSETFPPTPYLSASQRKKGDAPSAGGRRRGSGRRRPRA